MSGPWEKFQKQESGPWDKYGSAEVETPKPEQKPLAANAGMANLAATVLGLPVEAAKGVYNAGAMAIGTPLMAAFGPEWEQQVYTDVPGDINSIRNALRKTGVAGLNPDNPRPESKGETLAYDLTSRGGMVPGLALPAIGSVVAERTLGPEWAGVGALAPAAGLAAYNAARAPSLARQESQNAVRDSTLRDARQEGYVVPPSASGGGGVSKTLESFGGKAAMGQKAAVKNQQVTNALARKEIGLTKDAPITQEVLDNLRYKLAAPYREVAKVSPTAAKALERLQETRLNSKLAWQEYNRQGARTAYKEAKAFDAEADVLEKVIGREALKAKQPELLADLRSARTSIAKVHDVDRALNAATGDVSAKVLGKAFDKGKPISGGLRTAGRFAEAFPAYAREGAVVPSPDVSATNLMASGMLGYGGFQAMGPYGLTMAAIPFMRGGTRAGLLSGPAQNAVMPSYAAALKNSPTGPLLLQQLGILNQ